MALRTIGVQFRRFLILDFSFMAEHSYKLLILIFSTAEYKVQYGTGLPTAIIAKLS